MPRLSLLVALALVAGCSVSTTDNSITIKTQTKYTGTPLQKESTKDWTSEEIEIDNVNGSVKVIGDATATKIRLNTVPFAFADGADAKAGTTGEPDAKTAILQVNDTVIIDESVAGKISIRCKQSTGKVGSAAQGTTGCDDFTVTVPGRPMRLSAIAHNGSISAGNLTAVEGAQIQIGSANGDATAANITGGAVVKSDNGDVEASIRPTKGATVEAIALNTGDVSLFLPADFSADVIELKAGNGFTSDFSDVTATTTTRGAAGTGAAKIRGVASDLGSLRLAKF